MTGYSTSAPYLLDPMQPELFPDVELALAEPDGLLAIGGDLSQQRLLAAYRQGIFPWYSDGQPVLWWSPNPRAVLYLKDFVISRSLRKSIKNKNYTVTLDTAFYDVIHHCGQKRKGDESTWITNEMTSAYLNLHHAGFAHSVECWHDNKLVGGLYGISLGKAFFGESMFSLATDASKVSLAYLVKYLSNQGFSFIDCQIPTEHLAQFGTKSIARPQFITELRQTLTFPDFTGKWTIDLDQSSF